MTATPPPKQPPKPSHSNQYPQGPPPKKSKAWLFILLGVLGLFLLCMCITPFLLLPAVQQVREVSRAAEAENRGRQIGIALSSYHDTFRRFPTATIERNGQAKHSWRVAVLSFLEQHNLQDRYDLTESWDQGTNLDLSELQLKCFESLRGDRIGNGHTHFVAVVGPDTVITNQGKGTTYQGIADGAGSTIMLIEYVDSDIPWSKPEDVTVDQAVKIIKGNKSRIGTIVVFADGHTSKIGNTINEDVLRGMFTRNGGETEF